MGTENFQEITPAIHITEVDHTIRSLVTDPSVVRVLTEIKERKNYPGYRPEGIDFAFGEGHGSTGMENRHYDTATLLPDEKIRLESGGRDKKIYSLTNVQEVRTAWVSRCRSAIEQELYKPFSPSGGVSEKEYYSDEKNLPSVDKYPSVPAEVLDPEGRAFVSEDGNLLVEHPYYQNIFGSVNPEELLRNASELAQAEIAKYEAQDKLYPPEKNTPPVVPVTQTSR